MRCDNCGASSQGDVKCAYCKSVFPHTGDNLSANVVHKEEDESRLLSSDVTLILKKIDYIKRTSAPDSVKFQKIEVLKSQLRKIGYEI
jgi:hypothetical protein